MNNNTNNNQIQPVRSSFGTATVAPAQAPPAPPNETTQSNFNLNDIDFAFDERGNLVIVPANQTQEPSEEVEVGETRQSPLSDNVETIENNQPLPDTQPTSSDVSSRIEKIEGAIFQLAQYLDSRDQSQGINLNQNNQNTQQPNIDFQSDDWPTQIVSLINQSVAQAIDAKLKPMQSDFNSMKVRNDFQDAAARHGQPFLDLVPEMTEIKKSDPNVSWDILYQSMSKIRDKYKQQEVKQDSTIRTNDVVNNNQQKGKALLANATQLRNRANQMKTESSTANANIAPQAKQINSIDDAVNAALEEMYG